MTMHRDTILFYLDDDQEDLVFFKDAASQVGPNIEVFTLTRSEELINELHNPPPIPYAIFLDVNMPKRNGLDVLATIRKNNQFDHIPVVMFTTSDSPEVIEKSQELGANLFISKPSNFTDLKKAIQYTLTLNWKELLQDQFLYVN